jgi:hypothetical protein
MGLLCTALIIFISLSYGSIKVKASSGNDTYDVAEKISVNETKKSVLNSKEDVDWYRFEVNDSVGVEWIDFKSTSIEKSHTFHVVVYKEEDGMPATILEDSGDWMSAPEKFLSREFSFEKGTVLYIKVFKGYIDPSGIEYTLSIGNSKEPVKDCVWAIENDDSYENANKITSKNQLCGILNSDDDVDWYKYEVKNTKNFSFVFKSTIVEKEHCFRVEIFESEDGMPKDRIADSGDWMSAPEKFVSEEYSYEKGTILYVKVRKGYQSGKGIRYIMSVKDSVKDSSQDSSDNATGIETPYSILAGTNVVVGKADAGSTVNVKYGKKTYKATADENGIYRVKTAKLKKGKKVTIWQTVGKTSSEKISVKVVEKY